MRLAKVEPGDRVLEVGAGMGNLTLGLAEAASEVLAVELDRGLLAALREVTEPVTNVRVVAADALTLDYRELLAGGYRMISNLPYNVAVPLMARLLSEVEQIEDFVVMVQREVGDRLASEPGSRSYGVPSVLVRYYCDIHILGNVPPTVFWPRPKVDSVLLSLIRRPAPVEGPPERIMAVARAAFGQRRKTLRNALSAGFGMTPAESEALLQRARIEPGRRAESLSIEDFARIAAEVPWLDGNRDPASG